MNKKITVIAVLFLFVTVAVFSATPFEKIKEITVNETWLSGYAIAKAEIEKVDAAQKAQAYSMLSWITMEYGDEREKQKAPKDELLGYFSEGEQYGLKAAQLGDYKGWFWAAANIGRYGETKGILDSLAKADPMYTNLKNALNKDKTHDDSWNLLGMLYFGLSKQDTGIANFKFGGIQPAVSSDRKALEVSSAAVNPSFVLELCKHLYARNLTKDARLANLVVAKDKYNSSTEFYEKMKYYEGVVDYAKAYYWTKGSALNTLSDREEAILGMFYIKSYLESKKAKSGLLPSEVEYYEKAVGFLKKWKQL